MRLHKWTFLLLAAVLGLGWAGVRAQEEGAGVCRHAGGATQEFDFEGARQSMESLLRDLRKTSSWREIGSPPAVRAVAGAVLPGCRQKKTVRVRRAIPGVLIGKVLLWSTRAGKGDLVFRVGSSSWDELLEMGAMPADSQVAREWGVRCVPTRIRFLSADEMELQEGMDEP